MTHAARGDAWPHARALAVCASGRWALLLLSLLLVQFAWAAAEPQSYILAPNDTVQVEVWGQPEAAATLRVRPDGYVSHPLAGEVQAAGLTVAQFTEVLRRALTDYYQDPKLAVQVLPFKLAQVYVQGEVTRRGAYDYQPNLRVSDYLGLAGGATPQGDVGRVQIRGSQPGAQPAELDLRPAPPGQTRPEVVVQPGDTIYVPELQRVSVGGEVTRPGTFPYEPGLRISHYIGLAGGLTPQADPLLLVTRASAEGIKVIRVDYRAITERGEAEADLPSAPGDTILVQQAQKVSILGQVHRPGSFPYVRGYRITDYVALAGGPTVRGDTERAEVSRAAEAGKSTRVNVARLMARPADPANLELQPGDVVYLPEKFLAGGITWSDMLNVFSSLLWFAGRAITR